jgi:hypothetical protein
MPMTDPRDDDVILGDLSTCPDCGQVFDPELRTGPDPDICDDCAGEWERRRRRWERRRRGSMLIPLGQGRRGAVPIARRPGTRGAL